MDKYLDRLGIYAARLVSQKEYFVPGHRACQGCAEALAVRLMSKALGKNTVIACATGCICLLYTSPSPRD